MEIPGVSSSLTPIAPGSGEKAAFGRLLAAAVELAQSRGVRRLWLITTNDNIRALRFYQSRGMDMRAIHRDFVDTVRRLKSFGPNDRPGEIAFRHAIEFSY